MRLQTQVVVCPPFAPIPTAPWNKPKRPLTLLLAAALLALAPAPTRAALLDVWRAADLTLNNGDSVGSWSSATNQVATAAANEQPVFIRAATPAGSDAVRFSSDRMVVSPSPVAGRTAFSIAIVFKAAAVGVNNNAQWWGKSGIVDAEQPGVRPDWGTVISESGQVGIGTGDPDNSTYSTGASLVGTNYHVAVFAWGNAAQTVYIDNRTPVSQSGVSATPRENAGFSIGGIHTAEFNRRFNGDLVELRFYDAALSALEASNVIWQLTDSHLIGNLPRILSFTASTNQVMIGHAITLAWVVTNAATVFIDNGVGSMPAIGSLQLTQIATTTYTLSATNANGSRSATVTVLVDQGIPIAFDLSTNTLQNAPLPLTLLAADPNGGTLTYAIVNPPVHGLLSGTPPNVTYTPALDYIGRDAFTFKVNDGMFDSPPGTIAIKVIPPPMPPSGIALTRTNLSPRAAPGSFLALIQAIDVNEEDTHTFALVPGFGDNAVFAVSSNQLFAGPGFAAGVGATFNIRLRATDNTGFSVEQTFLLTVLEEPQHVVINEIHYNEPINQIREEFIELHNPTPAPVDLSNWRVRGGVDFFIPPGTSLPPGGFLVIAENPAVLQTRYGVSALGPWTGALNNEGEEITFRDADNQVIDRVDFRSEFPWPIAANGAGASMQLVNPSLDNDLGSSWRSGIPPTPGATNAVYATNAPPNIRQVSHSPRQPASTNEVLITCKVTDPDGVASVQLHVQVVAPGSFIPATLPLSTTQLNSLNTNPGLTNTLNPAFEDPTNWVTLPMSDDGLNGDAVAGDQIYTAVLPQRANRTLVRYRITATDALGASRRAPFEDDESLNFAYFVYDGIPSYQGVAPAVLESLPVYFLVTRAPDLNQCTAWFNTADQLQRSVAGSSDNEGRYHFNWEGAIVYDGAVYDHILYRLRGANGRYHPGKRSFRFRFNEGRLLEARNQRGEKFPAKWKELTTGKGQSNRGSETFALQEVINYFLWNKVGVPAPATFHFHFRVVRGPAESPDPYNGDFWGLNWAQEKYDVRFLEAHNLPKGNLYKLNDYKVDPLAEDRYFAPFAGTNGADFFNIENNLTGFQPADWLLAHVNYTNWFRYHAVAEGIRHYDFWPSANKNAAWYFEPVYTPRNGYLGRMMTLPYDSTDTWGPTWNAGEDVVWNGIFASTTAGGDAGQNPELQKLYRNVVREVRDLLFQPDQLMPLIDAFAAPLKSFMPADLARWSNAPAPANYVSMTVPGPALSQGLPGYVQDLKNFLFVGGYNPWWVDRQSVAAGGWVTRLDQVASDASIPQQPLVTYAGTNGFPLDGLVFRTSPFMDPQGSNTFAALEWRLAEITPTNQPVSSPDQLKLEWDAVWRSGELTAFNEFITLPAFAVLPDHLYRVRVRHQDNSGRWSRWSPPVEFRPGPADLVSALRTNLVFSEIMYNPPGAAALDGDEFEFLELKNLGAASLDLSGLFFSSGINFTFTNGTRLAAHQVFLLARNPAALQTRYPALVVNGVYTGKLNNDGEQIAVSHPHAGLILSVTYADRAPWPVTADGFGFSLVRDPLTGAYGASESPLGSPGIDAPPSTIGGVVINEVLSSSTLPLLDTIELLNIGNTTADVSGWFLSDDPAYPWKFRIPTGTTLAPGAFYTLDETQFNPNPGIGPSFSLSSFGDEVYLFSANSEGALSGYSHGFAFGGAQDGVTFGRYVNSAGQEQFPSQISATFGATNSGPRVGPLVITEIYYHPQGLAEEFLELQNLTGSDLPLYDPAAPANTWKVAGLGFSFPINTIIPANGYLLLVNGDPGAFRAHYQVPDSVPTLACAGVLQDNGENLELQAPDAPTTNGTPWYAVDTVRYDDRPPWPQAADGAGASLQRLEPAAYGNDPINWAAASPTPGHPPGTGTPPVILSQPGSRACVAFTTVRLEVSAGGAEPLYYQWRFNGANLDGATNATLVLTNLQLENAGAYSTVVYNAAGSAESGTALLTIRLPATITQQPANVIVRIRPDPAAAPSTNATFTVAATTFNPPLRLQWQFKGADIPGATNTSLTITNVRLENEGIYTVLVSDGIGTIVSAPANLYPLIALVFTLHPVSQTVPVGATVTLSAAATGNPLPFTWEWRRSSTPIFTNIAYERTGFITFTATNIPANTQYRVVLRTLNTAVASSYAVITTLADSDGDGLPDQWENSYGLNPTNAADRDLDLDLDGASNWQEYIADTDPTNASSFLKLELATGSGQPTVSFAANSNKTYTVQYSDQLGSPWSKLADVPGRTNSRVESIIDPGWTSNRFYRLVTPRQP